MYCSSLFQVGMIPGFESCLAVHLVTDLGWCSRFNLALLSVHIVTGLVHALLGGFSNKIHQDKLFENYRGSAIHVGNVDNIGYWL